MRRKMENMSAENVIQKNSVRKGAKKVSKRASNQA